MNTRNCDLVQTLVWRLVKTRRGWCALVGRGRGVLRSCLPEPTAEAALQCVGLVVEAQEMEGGGDRLDPDLEAGARFVEAVFSGQCPAGPVRLDLEDLRPYSRDVLLACSRVPYGTRVSYGELAAAAGHPGTARAVGQVMARNPLAPLVPCHRVVGGGGALVGFAGGLELKARLLEWEREEAEG